MLPAASSEGPRFSSSLSALASSHIFTARILFHAARQGPGPETLSGTLVHDFEEVPIDAAWSRDDWSLDVSLAGLAPGKYTVRVDASDEDGQVAEPILLPFWIEPAPFDWRDALIYMMLTDRYVNGDPGNDPGPTAGASPRRTGAAATSPA